MKRLPDNWTFEQKAFFAGLISARVPVRHLQTVFSALRSETKRDAAYFDYIIAILEPRISPARWVTARTVCERYFA
jgi:hypothetical protein